MKKFMKTTVLSLFLIFCITTLPGIAQRYWSVGEGYYGLDLTDEQLNKIQDLRLEYQKEVLTISSKLRMLYMEWDTMEMKGEERTKIEALFKDLEKLELDMERMYVEHQKQIRSLLTEKQKVLFDEFGGLGLGPAMGMGMGFARGYRGRMAPGYGRGMAAGRGYGRGRGLVSPRGYPGDRYWGRGTGYAGRGTGYFGRPGWNPGAGNGWISAGARGRFCPRFYFNRQYLYRNRR